MANDPFNPLLDRAHAQASDYLRRQPDRHVGARANREELLSGIRAPLTQQGEEAGSVIDLLAAQGEQGAIARGSPRYLRAAFLTSEFHGVHVDPLQMDNADDPSHSRIAEKSLGLNVNSANGAANLVELDVEGPAGRIEALSLRLYDPEARQWSLNFSNIKGGTMSPPTIGEFKHGRGEFFSHETFNGRAILVRFVISDITPTSCHFEQAFSEDGGKTWEVNWIATDTRMTAESGDGKTM